MRIRRNSSALLLALAVSAIPFSASPASAVEVKVSGAAGLANTWIVPHKAEIESASGQTLAVTINGDGNGLRDLTAGRSDLMMVAAPLSSTLSADNKSQPGSASLDGVSFVKVGVQPVRLVVHPSNPVKALTVEQAKAILSGKTTNWREVGGPDLPILLVAEAPGFGTRSVLEHGLGVEIAASARVMQALANVAQVVAQAPAALGYGSPASITQAVQAVSGVEAVQELGLAAKGTPRPEIQRVIDAVLAVKK